LVQTRSNVARVVTGEFAKFKTGRKKGCFASNKRKIEERGHKKGIASAKNSRGGGGGRFGNRGKKFSQWLKLLKRNRKGFLGKANEGGETKPLDTWVEQVFEF